MLVLTCPYCGVSAEETEFQAGGEAHLVRAAPGSSEEAFEAYMALRANPVGVHFERWRHVYGCGKWFLAARDTVTMEVFGTYPAQTKAPPPEILANVRARRPGWRADETEESYTTAASARTQSTSDGSA